MEFSNLPPEVVTHILTRLNFSDLKSVTQVSKPLNILATDPLLWRGFELSYQDPDVLVSALRLPRLCLLSSLTLTDLNCDGQTRTIVSALTNISLDTLEVDNSDLRCIPPFLFSAVILKTSRVELSHDVRLAPHQVEDLLAKMAVRCKETRLISLQLEHVDMREQDENIFAEAFTSLTRFSSYHCLFTTPQLASLFTLITLPTSKLRDLALCATHDLSPLPGSVLARAVTSLHGVLLAQTQLTPEQLEQIIRQIPGSGLRSLKLVLRPDPALLSSMPCDVLGQALAPLTELVIPFLRLSECQVKQVLSRMADQGNIRSLDLGEFNTLPSSLSLETLRKLCDMLRPSQFKCRLQTRILQLYKETIDKLKEELSIKEVQQQELYAEQRNIQEEAREVRYKIRDICKSQKNLTIVLRKTGRRGDKMNRIRLAVVSLKRSRNSYIARYTQKNRRGAAKLLIKLL